MNVQESINTPAGIDIIIIDDHQLVLEGLRSLLCGTEGIRNVQMVHTGKEFLEILPVQAFDIYLLDIELPDIDGFTLIEAIHRHYPHAKVIVNTMHEEIWFVRKLAEANVDAVLFKSSAPTHILTAINTVKNGGHYYCPQYEKISRHLDKNHAGLPISSEAPSPRELDVLKAMAKGYSTVEISRLLFISENTVETHRKNLMLKFGARNATDLVMRALARGFLSLPVE